MRISDRDTANRAARARFSHETATIALVRGGDRWYGRAFGTAAKFVRGEKALVRRAEARYVDARAKAPSSRDAALVRERDARYDGCDAETGRSSDCTLVPMNDARYDGVLGGFCAMGNTPSDCALVLTDHARYDQAHTAESRDMSSQSQSTESFARRSHDHARKTQIFRALSANKLVLLDAARYDAFIDSNMHRKTPQRTDMNSIDHQQQNHPGDARPGLTAEWAGVVRPGEIRYPGAHNPGPRGSSFVPCRFGGRQSRFALQH